MKIEGNAAISNAAEFNSGKEHNNLALPVPKDLEFPKCFNAQLLELSHSTKKV